MTSKETRVTGFKVAVNPPVHYVPQQAQGRVVSLPVRGDFCRASKS